MTSFDINLNWVLSAGKSIKEITHLESYFPTCITHWGFRNEELQWFTEWFSDGEFKMIKSPNILYTSVKCNSSQQNAFTDFIPKCSSNMIFYI